MIRSRGPAALLLLVLPLATGAASLPAAAAGSGAKTAAGPSAERSVLPWIADDYARAVAEARARRVPLFIEAWAPW